ncbi:MAG: hypothetical protein ACE5KH_04005 [Candidatus Geothermarchaeales archaeon]
MPDVKSSVSRPPLNILINPESVKAQKTWDIDLAYLLDLLDKVLKESGVLDLRVCGSAAVTSSLIYRLKVETLFLFEKIRSERRAAESALGELPQMLNLPFRYELHSTSAKELVSALEVILEEVLSHVESEKSKGPVLEPAPQLEIDEYEARIGEMLKRFRLELMMTLDKEGPLSLRDYVKDQPVIEKVRAFILLLFIAMEGLIDLEQDGEDLLVRGTGKDLV